jgi:periplasmic protein TonB
MAIVVSFALHVWFVWGVRVVAPRPAAQPGAIRATLAPASARLAVADVPAAPTEAPLTAASAPPANAEAPKVSKPTPAPTPFVAPTAVPQPPAQERASAPPDQVDAPEAIPEPSTFGPALELPQIEDPEFYPARQLDVLPRPLDDVALRYPETAADQDLSGRVVLLILIDELGMVVEASVISADPPGVFEEAALESFRSVMFSPAIRHGRAVKSRLPVEVNFDAKVGSLKQ